MVDIYNCRRLEPKCNEDVSVVLVLLFVINSVMLQTQNEMLNDAIKLIKFFHAENFIETRIEIARVVGCIFNVNAKNAAVISEESFKLPVTLGRNSGKNYTKGLHLNYFELLSA